MTAPGPTEPVPAEVEREALARVERLVDAMTPRQRARVMAGANAAVCARVAALETRLTAARDALPTLIPGSGELDDAALPPVRVGAFRLTERIGRGGMGEVWAGSRDDGLYEQRVAIKLIQRHALARAANAFNEERRFLARLEHPNIARLIDGGVTSDGLPWLVMEYVDGRAIDEASVGLAIAERIELFVKAADAVQYAHGRMIAHADLKPSNMLVDRDRRLKLLDFGIAGLIDGDAGLAAPTAGGAVTRNFASPQRLAGAGPSVADDVFALGCTLAAMLDGTVDRELAAIIAKARHPDEAGRYGSAAALIADLERWRARLPIDALPPTWLYRAGKFVERHHWGVSATAVALVLLSATSLFATSSYVRAEGSRARAEARFAEVRDLSRFMLFDLYDALARRPGTVTDRAAMAKTSARYLDRLNVSGETGIDLRLETARSYRRLGEIQGVATVSNLGQPAEASRALDRAAVLLRDILAEQPNNIDALTELGWVELDRWSLRGDNPAAAKALGIADDAFARARGVQRDNAPAHLGQLAVAQGNAYGLVWANRSAQAVPVAQAALADLRATTWPPALAPRAAALEIALLNQLGDAIYYAGDMAGSLVPYREAAALIDRRIATEGATPELVIAKGGAAFNISGTLGDMGGRRGEALSIARNAIAGLRDLLAVGPDALAEKRLLVLYGQEAVVLENMGRIDAALGPLRAGIALREARMAAAPRDPQRARDLAIGLIQQARVLGLAGQHDAACEVADRNAALWRQISTRGDLSAHDAAREVSKTETIRKKYCRS